ncbi:MAG: hypothetical protein RM338_05625 [Nostoc sp. DedQUE12a]|nr:hypothetical protein [Nostoc sp. DedQUE12a]
MSFNKVYFQDGDEERMIDIDLVRHVLFMKQETDGYPLINIWYGDSDCEGAMLSFSGDIATRLWKVIKMVSRKLPE